MTQKRDSIIEILILKLRRPAFSLSPFFLRLKIAYIDNDPSIIWNVKNNGLLVRVSAGENKYLVSFKIPESLRLSFNENGDRDIWSLIKHAEEVWNFIEYLVLFEVRSDSHPTLRQSHQIPPNRYQTSKNN